jgi:hypothetical protein
MLRSTGAQLPALNLLTRQMDALSLTCGRQSKRAQTRISPRGWRMPDYNSYDQKYWSRARPFPPNWADDHHIFYPSLDEVLQQQQSILNPIRLIDIGIPKSTVSPAIDGSQRQLSRSERRKKSHLQHTESAAEADAQLLQSLLARQTPHVPFDYDLYTHQWLRNEEGVNETQSLAHHYQIYRDLFSSRIVREHTDPVPKVRWGDIYPRPDHIAPEVYDEHFPGAVRADRNVRPLPIYHFRPIVPMHVEFAVRSTLVGDEREDDPITAETLNSCEQSAHTAEEDTIVSCVYRGNVIRPRYTQTRPSVVIDSSVFTSHRSGSPITADQLLNTTADGQTKVIGDDTSFYTICLLSLDSLNGDALPICHWMQCNVHSRNGPGHEQYSYLPAFGIQGLGYHRYAFLLFRHASAVHLDSAVTGNVLHDRQFNPLDFVKTNADLQMTPVGLSWFQSTYDATCKRIFHETLQMQMPTYEYVQSKMKLNKQVKFPGPAPFNSYLDHFRDSKEIAKEVLLERLQQVRPFDYHRQIQPSPLPANIYKIPHDSPSWLRSSIWKRRNRLGAFRALRPASALQAHNNNADLDNPMWPHPSRLEVAMRYPFEKRAPVPLRQTKWSLPPQEHPHLRVQTDVDVPTDSTLEAKQFDAELELINPQNKSKSS